MLLLLIPLAALLISTGPESAFDHARFCHDAGKVMQTANGDRGKWLDEFTRHDGVVLDCEARAVETKLFVTIAFKDIAGNWRDRTNFKWNEDYCNDPAWQAAITHQWKVFLTVTSSVDEVEHFRAACH